MFTKNIKQATHTKSCRTQRSASSINSRFVSGGYKVFSYFIQLKRKTSERSFLGAVMQLCHYLAIFIGLFRNYAQRRSVFALPMPRIR